MMSHHGALSPRNELFSGWRQLPCFSQAGCTAAIHCQPAVWMRHAWNICQSSRSPSHSCVPVQRHADAVHAIVGMNGQVLGNKPLKCGWGRHQLQQQGSTALNNQLAMMGAFSPMGLMGPGPAGLVPGMAPMMMPGAMGGNQNMLGPQLGLGGQMGQLGLGLGGMRGGPGGPMGGQGGPQGLRGSQGLGGPQGGPGPADRPHVPEHVLRAAVMATPPQTIPQPLEGPSCLEPLLHVVASSFCFAGSQVQLPRLGRLQSQSGEGSGSGGLCGGNVCRRRLAACSGVLAAAQQGHLPRDHCSVHSCRGSLPASCLGLSPPMLIPPATPCAARRSTIAFALLPLQGMLRMRFTPPNTAACM